MGGRQDMFIAGSGSRVFRIGNEYLRNARRSGEAEGGVQGIHIGRGGYGIGYLLSLLEIALNSAESPFVGVIGRSG